MSLALTTPPSFAVKAGQSSKISTGIVEFEEGGRLVINLTEADPQQLRIGGPLRMSYRIHAVDKLRGFTRYFWKGVPLQDQIEDQKSGESKA